MPIDTRPLTREETELSRWMLVRGDKSAQAYLEQLDRAEATIWKCPCGCASFKFKIRDLPEAPAGVGILGDYVFGTEDNLAGALIFQSGGILSGVEVYGLAAEAPSTLPHANELRPWSDSITAADREQHRNDA